MGLLKEQRRKSLEPVAARSLACRKRLERAVDAHPVGLPARHQAGEVSHHVGIEVTSSTTTLFTAYPDARNSAPCAPTLTRFALREPP